MTETQERFLRTVLSRVDLDSLVEFHLFPPIRRGTMETGVAVIATRLPTPTLAIMADDEGEAGAFDPSRSPYADESAIESSVVGDGGDVGDVTANVSASETEIAEVEPVVFAALEPAPAPVPVARHRILTASYRHTIKGVDRGKWLVEVQEEADAPLAAVEAVLRGVRHRSSEASDPESITLDALSSLGAPAAIAPAA